MIAGKDAYKPGEAKNSWLTGTASWNFYAISQYILGVRPDYDGLTIDPCIPADWKGYTVNRKYRGAEYRIEIVNDNGVSKGTQGIYVDGTKIKGNTIPVFEEGTKHKVVAILGDPVK